MRVYRNPALLGAIEVLAANFPVTKRILGDRRFEAEALGYARANPPFLPIPKLYGRGMADWLAAQPVSAELPFIRDVARCDELAAEAGCAAQAAVLMPNQLEIMQTSEVLNFRLRIHPSARFDWMGSEGVGRWLATRSANPTEPALRTESTGILVTCRNLSVKGFEIGRAAHRLLAGIRLGEMLGAAAQAAIRLYPNANIAECFEQLVERGAFVAPSSGRP
ncbi:MAG: hypothetical protein A3J40_05930 [Erythrobacter sp. RIFCSPHIGHO2_12_FULL_63_10]|nr:MAG: hypothetical protein A3J40_05930 [Erythrobacter sp. RIFCSPHIGHO2_12_FULL_63_10]